MIRVAYWAVLGGVAVLLMWRCSDAAVADPSVIETRYCVATPVRASDGRILRRTDVLLAYRKLYPCPSTGKTTGACPGWNIDHTIPLVCGGCDAVSNLTWLPVEIKRCGERYCKDRWEQQVYCRKAREPP